MARWKFIPDKSTLQALNEDAIKRGYSQIIEPTVFDRIPDTCYLIALSLFQNDGSVRCRIVLNLKGDTAFLDMSFAMFNSLPEFDAETKEVYGGKCISAPPEDSW